MTPSLPFVTNDLIFDLIRSIYELEKKTQFLDEPDRRLFHQAAN